MSADIADREQMRGVITRTLERFSEIHGVIPRREFWVRD